MACARLVRVRARAHGCIFAWVRTLGAWSCSRARSGTCVRMLVRASSCAFFIFRCSLGWVGGRDPSFAILHRSEEICRWESLNATCPPHHVVVMESARYGRMKLGRCLNRNYMIGCSGDVLKQADLRCSGRHNCTVRVPDETFHEVQPCPKDVMAYMEASYSCLPVVNPPYKTCSSNSE